MIFETRFLHFLESKNRMEALFFRSCETLTLGGDGVDVRGVN